MIRLGARQTSGMPRGTRRLRRLGFRLLACLLALALAPPRLAAPADRAAPRSGVHGMRSPQTGSLLASYYEQFLRDHDLELFRERVSARYNEGTLARLLHSVDVVARRAAVLAMGVNGSYASNADVARALADPDPTVRNLAENALWAIWFRADSPENNATLEEVRNLNNRRESAAAIRLATRLIADAPEFAEAYNQRAIAHFMAGRFEPSAADCRKVLELNPYHIGALSGLGRCLLHLDRPDEALRVYERALKLQPFDAGLKQMIAALKARGD